MNSNYIKISSESLASDPSCELEVLGHDGHSLGVDGAEVGVLEESDEVSFGSLLEGQNGGGLESQVLFELLGDFSDESLERKLSQQQVGGLLVFSDFS